MPLLLLLFIFVATVILLVQNQQPVVLYFLGTNPQTALFTLTLPIGVWVVLFTVAGIVTSLMIQFLNRSPQITPSKSSPPPPRRDPPKTPPPKPQPSEFPESSEDLNWESVPKPNWEGTEPQLIEEEDDWKIEEPPIQPTIPRKPREQLERELRRPLDENQGKNFEREQPPARVSQQGSVYSYTYRELQDSQENESSSPPQDKIRPRKEKTSEQVYDANYRVLKPPYRQPQEETKENEEEDWI